MTMLLNWFQLGLGVLGVIFLGIILILLIVILSLPLVLRGKKQGHQEIKINVKKLNDVYEKNSDVIAQATLSSKEYKKFIKNKKKQHKTLEKTQEESKNQIYVLDFKGDIAATQVTYLREQITVLLNMAKKTDEIVVRIESPGGLVHTYGLAASQLARIRQAGIPLTVCVDKVAASGGYMMACLADKILSAPFAILGSIGVLSTIPNFNKLLKKYDVDYYEITAGKYKRTLTPLGEPTQEKIDKSHEKVQEIHQLFKDHIHQYRNKVDIENIANGDYWFGHQALALKLIDEIKTSDDYLLEMSKTHNIYFVFSNQAQSFRNKILSGFTNIWYTLFNH